MGCLSDKKNLESDSLEIDNYESYPEPDGSTFDLIFYKLGWKSKPNICIYQKIDEETLDKYNITCTNDLFQISQIEEMKLVPQLYEMKNVLFYIYISEGVIITTNIRKVNQIFSEYKKSLIKCCIVDISSIIMTGSEYNSIHEIKKQSRFYFDLNLKEINFLNRNNLINHGKNEELSDTEIDLDDEDLEEQEKNRFEQYIHTSNIEKEEEEEEYEYEYNEKEISKLSIENVINKKKVNHHNMDYLETNANEINIKEDINKEQISDGGIDEMINNDNNGYTIDNDTLIISMEEMSNDIKEELKKLFYAPVSKDESPYLYKQFYNPERETKKKKNKLHLDDLKEVSSKEMELNDYIQIYKKSAIPYEKRNSLHKITKIVFKNCTFDRVSLLNLKDFFNMLSYYSDLLKISIGQNNVSNDYIGWKFIKQLVKENFNIRWVSFKDANLNDSLFEGIIMGMTLKRIRYLNLSKNKITNKGLYFLNKFLMKNQTLLILDLSYNQHVTSEGIKLITNALKMHPNINKVNFSHMRIKGSGHYISNFIKDNKCLRSLYLKNCMFEKPDIEYFPTVFSQKDCQIQHLDLSLNSSVGEDGLKEIGKLITNNKSLISIGLDGMNLSMNNYMPVFQGILKNKTIRSYSLNINPGLPLKGILNFLLKNQNIKEISLIPWDYTKDKTKKFNDNQLQLFERFHKKAPDVIINGIYFN